MLDKTQQLKDLCKAKGLNYVGFRGWPKAPIWLVGESPGADEDQNGVPFVGYSGRELDKMLLEAGINPQDCCFVNPYKVRPPENKLERIEELGIPKQVFEEQFFEEIDHYKPTFLVSLGGTPTAILCPETLDRRDNTSKISKWRGSLLLSPRCLWPHYVLPNFHPAYILREWSDRDVSVFIFAKLREEFDYWKVNKKLQPLPERQLIAEPSYAEANEYLINCIEQEGPVSIDIELLARKVPITIAFSFDPKHAISLDFFNPDTKHSARIWRLINLILNHKWIVGQNFTTFDINWIQAIGLDVNVNLVDDTLIMHHVKYPEMSHKLDFLGMQLTREAYWKDEGKGWNLREGMKKLRRYNALDSAATLEISLRLIEELLEDSGQTGGISLLHAHKNLAAGFGLEAQTETSVRVAELQKVLNSSSEYSSNFSGMISKKDFNYIIPAKIQDALILGTQNNLHTENIEQNIKEIKSLASTDTNSLQKTPSLKKVKDVVESVEKGKKDLFEFYKYEMSLARSFHSIDKRGILTDSVALSALRTEIVKELDECCVRISQNLSGRAVASSAKACKAIAKALNIDVKGILNIGAPAQIKTLLQKDLKIKLKVSRSTKKESTNEEALNEAFATTGNPVLKDLLRTRELNKILGTYVDAALCNNVFYSCYSVTGTVTGRRASRKNFLGFGSNGQNQPKHSDLGDRFQGIFISRPDRIFVYCDQASAEEWIVQGLIADASGNTKGIEELHNSIKTGISRHAILASQIFGLPIEKVNDKECLEYYMGKKTRHAGNYGMFENTMASQLAAEGFHVGVPFCKTILTKFHQVEPLIKQVFHKSIEEELNKTRLLKTPLGRERVFHGLRPFGDNGKIYREAYAWKPQSTIGDNNGMAIQWMEENHPDHVLADGHDSMLCETFNNLVSVQSCVEAMQQAYKRDIVFPNGFIVNVPVDFKIGYSIKGLRKCQDCSTTGLTRILETLHQRQKVQRDIICGQQSVVSVQP